MKEAVFLLIYPRFLTPRPQFQELFCYKPPSLGSARCRAGPSCDLVFLSSVTLTGTTRWGAGSAAPLKVKVVPLQVGRGAGPQGVRGTIVDVSGPQK